MLNAARHAGTLPAREHDVLALMAEGRSSSAIADQLVVTPLRRANESARRNGVTTS